MVYQTYNNYECTDEFNNKKLTYAIDSGKCPVVDVLKTHYSLDKNGSHVMVATGIKMKMGSNGDSDVGDIVMLVTL